MLDGNASDEDVVDEIIEGWLRDFRESQSSVVAAMNWLKVPSEAPQREMISSLFEFAVPLSPKSARTFIRGTLLAIKNSVTDQR